MSPDRDLPCLAGLAPVLERVPLTGAVEAYSGATFERVVLADGTRLVVKTMPVADWLTRATRDSDRLGQLWTSGILERVPAGIDHAIVATELDGDRRVVVMRDVSPALVARGATISRAESRRFLDAAAHLHRVFWGERIDGLCPLADYYGLFSPATAEREQADAESHTQWFPKGWERFDDVAPPDIGPAVLAVVQTPALLAAELEQHDATLVHGDLKLQNLGAEPGRVVLLDWGSLTGLAPPAVDFGWYLGQNMRRIDAAPEDVIADFRQAEGEHHDPRALDLALIGTLAHFGWKLALVATESQRVETATTARRQLEWWVHRIREALETWSPSEREDHRGPR